MTGHRHIAEIEQELSFLSTNMKVKVGFSAHGVNLVRGILSTSHVFFDESIEMDEKTIFKAYRGALKDEPFLRLVNQKTGIFRLPDPKVIVGTNYCDVGFQLDSNINRIVVLSALDNLVKGTAGNAVQCMNLMCGFPETTGLEFPGYFPQ
jgi:N-acetyl-gamma-glutamyl-phosphate/LysW-gamma-L-alpha-aminoadipyl-6-phosphate reductase